MASGSEAAVSHGFPTEQLYWVEEVAKDLSYPWAMAWLPNGDLLITERLGAIRLLRQGKLTARIQGTPHVLLSGPWDGLFDIKVDPEFTKNQYIYLTFTDGQADARIGRIFRARLENNALRDGTVIFTSAPAVRTNGPLMLRMLFLPGREMLACIGSGDFSPELVQRLDTDVGKVIRIRLDGSIPPDNPFRENPVARPELWAMGLRIPAGITRMEDGTLWVVDSGPKGGDELNQLFAGANYGWPLVTWGFEYSGSPVSNRQEQSGFISPGLVWSPSHTPSDLTLYRGSTYPFWDGDLFTGGLSGHSIRRIRIRNNQVVLQERLLADLNERIRSVQVAPDNFLYFLTDGDAGRLLRIRPGIALPGERSRVAVAKPVDYDTGAVAMVTRERAARRLFLVAEALKIDGDPVKGEWEFKQRCSGCHALGGPSSGRIGPDLKGLAGRRPGSAPDFDYSDSLGHSTLQRNWDKESLLNFIADPEGYLPGTKMATPSITDARTLSSIGEYLLK